MLDTYNSLAQKDRLKKLVADVSESQSPQNIAAYREFISEKAVGQIQQNTERMAQVITKYELQTSLINFEGPEKVREAILSNIRQISFFRGTDSL